MQKQKARRLNKPAFSWMPPSPKQEQILYWWTPESPYKDLAYFQAEGSVRCVKTVLADFSFVNWASYTYDQEEFALCSKTIGTAIRNQVRPLMKVLSVEPSYQVQFRRGREEGSHLTIYNKDTDHENIFWIYGGKDEASQDLIQGQFFHAPAEQTVERLIYQMTQVRRYLQVNQRNKNRQDDIFSPIPYMLFLFHLHLHLLLCLILHKDSLLLQLLVPKIFSVFFNIP